MPGPLIRDLDEAQRAIDQLWDAVMADDRALTPTIAGRISAAGAILDGPGGFTVSKGATGLWTLIFPQLRVVSVVVTAGADLLAYVNTEPTGGDRYIVRMYNSAGAAVDQPFSFVAVGVTIDP